ncbi:TetR/AcrR family transcriptional regulator [Microlunatus soli]|uniref:DNA-binding transcriptional regulator, AcrR family n=1 Tax=Microlunatus soli TaxID=630515 RepID=A0A1H1S2S1_9ACTN|nr:TetR/AcrR family transcriptional regulator [Microlunatus soli]SDS42098.1 DNA-binding transcriptional regulator, AcrR family [Microlunatus soli]
MAASTPRRAPVGDGRIRDAERTRNRLLDAALDEFAGRGYAGARVSAIADRAGVNKQLISYYFGGKQGLYRALLLSWEETEEELRRAGTSLSEVALGYLRRALRDPRGTRLALWQALNDRPPIDEAEAERERAGVRDEQADLRLNQQAGELADDLDLAATQLAITGMVIAPIVLPDLAAALFDEPVDSAAFESRYSDTLTKIIERLRDTAVETDEPPPPLQPNP